MNQTQEKVLMAAIQISGTTWTGKSHASIMSKLRKRYPHLEKITQRQQGFITCNHTFVDRKQAAKIAFNAGQISKMKEVLFSEDLL